MLNAVTYIKELRQLPDKEALPTGFTFCLQSFAYATVVGLCCESRQTKVTFDSLDPTSRVACTATVL